MAGPGTRGVESVFNEVRGSAQEDENVLEIGWEWLHDNVNVLNATELCALKQSGW